MSKLKNCKKIKEETKAFQKVIDVYISSLKKEYKNNIYKVKNELLELIAENEDLDIKYLKEKYLTNNISKKKTEENTLNVNNDLENLLEEVILDGKTYYFENKNSGIVYNESSEKVGSYINQKFVFD
jgi:hypothetical protein